MSPDEQRTGESGVGTLGWRISPSRRRRRLTLSGGVALASALLAIVSLAFSMQRASEENQSQLRSDLTAIVRRVTALNAAQMTPADANELAALLAQARAIIPQLDSVPAVYYAELSHAMLKGYYYEDSLNFADKALRQATDDDDVVQQIVARTYKASTYIEIREIDKARSEYRQAVALSDKAREGIDYVVASRLKVATLQRWGNAEASVGACDRAVTILDSGIRLAKSIGFGGLESITSSRDSVRKTCARAESAGNSARGER